MKKVSLSSSILSLVVACTILIIQGCAVYAPPVSIDEAIGKGRVKITTTGHGHNKYKSLIMENDHIFGVTGFGNSIRYEPVPDNIRYARVKDRTASAILTTLALLGGACVIAAPAIALNSLAESMSGFTINNGGGWCIDRTDQQPVLGK